MWKSNVTYRKTVEIDGRNYQRKFQGNGTKTSDYLWEVVTHNASYSDWSAQVEGYGSSWRKYWNVIDDDAAYDNLAFWDQAHELKTEIPYNGALKRISEQSSTAGDAPASRAVDGTRDGAFANNSVSLTQSEEHAWWQVDLGEDINIERIDIFNRTDTGETGNLSDFYIIISRASMAERPMKPATFNSIITNPENWVHQITGTAGPTLQVLPPVVPDGRFLMIVLSGTGYINLAEVEVVTSITNLEILSNISKNWRRLTRDDNYTPWTEKMVFGTYWQDFWKPTKANYQVGPKSVADVSDIWTEGWYYETSQSTTAKFDKVILDTNDIELEVDGNGVYRGDETGAVTVRPAKTRDDFDILEFELPEPGHLKIETSGCAIDEKVELKVFNRLGEQFVTKGSYDHSVSGDYSLSMAEVEIDGSTLEKPFIAAPGTYYLKVQLHSDADPEPPVNDKRVFKYSVNLSCDPSIGDDHGDYKELSTILSKWETVKSPLIYFNPESGSLTAPSGDSDFFRFDVPELSEYPDGAYVRIMSDSSDLKAVLYDSKGQTLVGERLIYEQYPYESTEFTGALVKRLVKGTYYIEIKGTAASYNLYVDLDDYGDYVNFSDPSLTAQKTFKGFGSFKGHFESESATSPVTAVGDKDYFTLSAESTGYYSIYTTGNNNTSAVLLNNAGGEVSGTGYSYTEDIDAAELNKNFQINVSGLSNGDYYIEVSEKNGKAGDYRMHIEQRDDFSDDWFCRAYDETNGIWVTGLSQCNPPVGDLLTEKSGVISIPGDIDLFYFDPLASAPNSGRLTVTSTGYLDPTASLYEFNEATNRVLRVTWNSDGAGPQDPLNSWIPSSSGKDYGNFKLEYDYVSTKKYLLGVKAHYPNDTGVYGLMVERVASTSTSFKPDAQGDDYLHSYQVLASGLSSSTTNAVYADGGIDLAGDVDYYNFDVTGKGKLTVSTKTPSGSNMIDTYGYLYAAAGADKTTGDGGMIEFLASNDDNPDSTVLNDQNFSIQYYVDETFAYTTSGTDPVTRFYVKVKGFKGSETGDYELHIEFDPDVRDLQGGTCGTAMSVGPDYDSAGLKIDMPGDHDYFRLVAGPVSTTEGGILTASSSTPLNSELDLLAYLKNYMCSTAVINDNGSGTGNNFSLSTPEPVLKPEIYYIGVRDFQDKNKGDYTLNLGSNGTFIDFEKERSWAPPSAANHYFGFEIPETASTLHITCTGSVVGTDFILLSGDPDIETEMPYTVRNDLGNDFTVSNADIDPGTYYLMVTPASSSVTAMTIKADRWHWTEGAFTGASGITGALSQSGVFSPPVPVKRPNAKTLHMQVTATDANNNDIYNSADYGYFAHRFIKGDFEISARVTINGTPDQYAKGGIMVRQSNASTSENIYVAIGGQHGCTWQTRLAAGVTDSAWDEEPASTYVKMIRQGLKYTLYTSSDGVDWGTIKTVDITAGAALSGDVFIGFAASPREAATMTFTFDEINFTANVSLFK